MKGKIIVQAATAVNNPESDKPIIYPVPLTGNILNVDLGHPVQYAGIQVYDISGSLLISKVQTGTGPFQIDCSSLLTGAYLIKIETPEGVKEIKFIK
jgi:hypothetical protein